MAGGAMDMSRYAEATAAEIAAAVRSGRASATAVVGACIDRIAAFEPRLNTLVTLTTEAALEAAHRVDALVAAGRDPGPLAGVPVTVKDLIAVGGVRQAFGSRLLADNVAAHDAPSVERLRAAGACIVGKSTTSELGSKAVGDSPLSGITRNPWNADHTAGGSSAGAAAGVAAGMVPVALATDGGGSIRIPSSFCGVFGIKARFGRVPVWPPAATPLLAHVGPITRSVADAALVLSVIAGPDPRDSGCVNAPVPDFVAGLHDGLDGLRIGWCGSLPYGRVDPQVAQRCREAAFALAGQGARVVEVDWPFPQDPGPAWNHLFYGRIAGRVAELAGTAERMAMVNASLREAIAHERAAGIGDAAAMALREQATTRVATLFQQVDLLLTPTMPVTAPSVGVDVPAGHAGRNAVDWSYFTYPFNLTGHPAASIPVGFDAARLPIGLQLVGRLDGEATILRVAAAIEQVHPMRGAPV
jgi:aspartyl-tRNA(Asn)/glutamyl-tRNA(Gln) amidotransferase subunit A